MKCIFFLFQLTLVISTAAIPTYTSNTDRNVEPVKRVPSTTESGLLLGSPSKDLDPPPPKFDPLSIFNPTAFLPTVPVYRVQELVPLLRPDATRVRITWGPTTLLAANESAPPGLFQPVRKGPGVEGQVWYNNLPGMPANATILFGKIGLEYEGGSPATADTGTYNHHIQFINIDSKRIRKEFCFFEPTKGVPRNIGGGVMIGAGSSDYEEGFFFTTPNATFNSGYVTGANDRFMISGQVVNYKNHRVDIYPTLEIEYVKEKPKGIMDVSVMLISVTGCDFRQFPNNEFLPPPGVKVWNISSVPFPLPEDGYIINALGHIHDGGVRVKSWIRGDELICDSEATYGMPNKASGHGPSHMGGNTTAETIVKMGLCDRVIPVKKGDRITLQAFFDLEKHAARENPMHGGMMGEMATTTMYFAPKNNETGGVVWLDLNGDNDDDH